MATLVSLSTAKTHLHITDDDHNADVALKLAQATYVILDYLKGRANNPFTITSSSVASPTVITTDDAHGFSNGSTVVIADHDDSAPSISGSYTLSNVTATTFTIPVAVTVAGTGGTATVAWTESTVPAHVQAAVLLMLTHLYEKRGDDPSSDEQLWQAVERLLMRARDPALA